MRLLGQAQLRQTEVRGVRVLADKQRIMGLAEKAGILAGRDGTVGDDIGKGNEGGRTGAGGAEGVHDGAVCRKQVFVSRSR